MQVRKMLIIVAALALAGCGDDEPAGPGVDVNQLISASLHNTTDGMGYFYGAAQGGMEQITGVPYDNLSCKNCHAAPTECEDCHTVAAGGGGTTTEAKCGVCHGRQNAERNPAFGFTDVHRTANMVCWDCHTAADVHGDGTSPNSLLEAGVILAQCDNDACHGASNPPDHSGNAVIASHLANVDCSACHVESVVSCYNCHFESELAYNQKIPYGQFKNWKFLVNDSRKGKVGTANLMTLTYDNQSFAVIAPYYAHTVVAGGEIACSDCHNNTLANEYDTQGTMTLVEWNPGDSTFTQATGAVPVPPDWPTAFQLDFATRDTVIVGVDTSVVWRFLKSGIDSSQMLYATPLTAAQVAKLQ